MNNNKSAATILLEDGRKINVTLDYDNAPISAANFAKLAESGFFSGLIFHRVIPNFMIQGGGMDINMSQKKATSIKGEFKSNGVNNNRKHKVGTLSMARTMVKDSGSSQFFICSADCGFLDNDYAAFGEVADEESLKIVLEISQVPTKSYQGHDDVPRNPIVIKSIDMQ